MDIEFEVLHKEGIIAIVSIDDSFSPVNLSIDKFWGWVERNELNTYCEDYYDPSEPDGHGQLTGTLSFGEYFDLYHELIKKDLIDYLKTHKPKN
mgnify:FL=1